MSDSTAPPLTHKNFTYASSDHNLFQTFLIRTVETFTGQLKIWKLYKDYTQEDPDTRDNFWNAAVKKLDLNVKYDERALAAIPQADPLVVVANHPYGVLDGLIITQLMKRVRNDFKVLTNSVLCLAPEAKEDLLPVDFAQTEEALKTNLETRRSAREILKSGGCIVVFPAGGVSTIPTWKDKIAQDTAWQPFIARLIQESHADVVPLFFHGQNSRLFQFASLLSPTLRLALFFKEVADKIGSNIEVRIGTKIPFEALSHLKDRDALCDELRSRTYALGGMTSLPPARQAYRIDTQTKNKVKSNH